MNVGRFIPYALRWRPSGVTVGAHPGFRDGSGGAFRQHVPLLRHPDPRRLDLAVTMRDPMGEVYVRQFAQRSAISVVALVDLSGSMGFVGRVGRMRTVAELCAVLAASAYRTGDRFGLVGWDSSVRQDVLLPPTRRMGLETQVFEQLMRTGPAGADAGGLIDVARHLPLRRSLVFLISDFLLPASLVMRGLETLWRHDVVPVRLVDRAEYDDLPLWRLIEHRDLETGRRRLTFMRPVVRDRWRRAREQHFARLRGVFARQCREAFQLVDGLDTDALARHLMAR